jgi:ribonuclease R
MDETTYTGKITVSGRGVGYFAVPPNAEGVMPFEDDIEIQTPLLKTALNNDEVEVKVLPAVEGIRRQGEVVKIITRAKMQFVGTLAQTKDFFFLKPDDRRMYKDIFVHSSVAKDGKQGDKVLVEITGWKDPMKSPEGKVLRVLGHKGIHNVEMEAIILERGFEDTFPKEIDADAQRIAKEKQDDWQEEIKRRKDFRGTLTFTIDPADAKDFDDALSFKKLPDGKYEIGVHIADVSHYVEVGTKLNEEAQKRGTSVYLVDRTIPMLPEILSNDLCSLNPNVERFTFSAVFTMDDEGVVYDKWFGKTVIYSDKRFSYEDAQATLDAKGGEYFDELNTMNQIAKKLQVEKFKNGAIEFETDEVKFELDAEGKPIRVYKKERKDTHKMIEEYMLLANREVAEYMFKAMQESQVKGAFIYRIHDVPDPEKIMNLSTFAKALGYDLDAEDGEVTAGELNKLLKAVDGKPEESLIKTAAIRSMSKAIYSTRNIGHFGLGFTYYTHFTSPIRRYPDLLVHRLLFRYLTKGKIGQDEFASFEKLCMDATQKEISASEAERASIKYKQVEFMLGKIGQEFDATISGVSEWGIYVEENETKAEGMVRLKNMTDDTYVLDQKNYAIVGTTTKKKYTLGDSVRVKLDNADLDKKILDFLFVPQV